MISEEMYEVMMHMIGYGTLTKNFIDAVHSCDHELLLELAEQCNERWGDSSVDIERLKRAIEQYNEEA